MAKIVRAPVNQRTRIYIIRATFLLILPLLLFVQPKFAIGSLSHEIFESIGILMLICGVIGRFWSILYIGSVKNKTVMREGPYSVTRNPLYVFSTIALTGVGLMFGGFFFAALVGGATFVILYLTARREAEFLLSEFGSDFEAYAREVPFFFPKPALYRSAPEITFHARSLRNNLFDALGFLAFIPIVELVDQFKTSFEFVLFFAY